MYELPSFPSFAFAPWPDVCASLSHCIYQTDNLPKGVWWDEEAVSKLLSPTVILLKPEGAFQGRDVVLGEYENL